MEYGNGKDARIRRAILEEDPGRLVYASGSMDTSVYVLIDYNRAGMPLVEIVTERTSPTQRMCECSLTR